MHYTITDVQLLFLNNFTQMWIVHDLMRSLSWLMCQCIINILPRWRAKKLEEDVLLRWESFTKYLLVLDKRKSEIESALACVASVSVQFGSKELQGDEWRGRKEGNACRQTPGFWKPPTRKQRCHAVINKPIKSSAFRRGSELWTKTTLQSKQVKRSSHEWINKFIFANLISVVISIIRSLDE